MASHLILGVHVKSFSRDSAQVQTIFSEYGCEIRTRLGLHDVADGVCSPQGLILVEFIGGPQKAAEMTAKLTKIAGIEVKQMTFDH
ncbi:MAG: hypothetical protein ACRC46_13570 [Thermoguttaceae bacterium]